MKILFIRFSSIGDIVLTTPVIRCAKQQLQDVEVHFLLKKSFAPVLQNNPYIDKRFYFDDSLKETINDLKKENYDAVVDLQKNIRSLRIKNALGIKSYSFDKLNFQKWVLVNLKIDLLPKIHIVDRYMKAVELLGVKNDGAGLDYFILPEDENVLNDLPLSYRNNYIAWVIGAKHKTKMLPLEKMKSIGEKIKSPIVLLGGKEDFERGEQLVEQNNVKFFNACGKYSLNQSAALVKNSTKVITHDTGLMHIASAFQKEIVSIWGNTVPEFGMYPYYGENKIKTQNPKPNISHILEVNNLSCRPCTKIGFEKCPRGHFKCMFNQNETQIIEKLNI